ncbi:MAG: hypothetical protein ACM3NQ_20440 [Bacteroidales bacterium]
MKRPSSTALFALVLALVVCAGALAAAVGQPVQAGQAQAGQTQARPAPSPQSQAKPPAKPVGTTTDAAADKPADKPETPALEQPADFKAFNEAAKTTDPVKRIEALQKFATDFPDSTLKSNAESQAKSQALTIAADLIKKYQAAVDKTLKGDLSNPFATYYSLANELSRAGVLLEQAEEYATKGLAAADEKKFIADYRANQAKPAPPSKLPPNTTTNFSMSGGVMTATLVTAPERSPSTPRREVTDDDLRSQFRSQRAQLQTTLAQIYVKRGKSAEAEKLFKAVYTDAATPASSRTAAARGLADMARKSGDDKALLEYLTVMVVAGSAPDVHKELAELYRKTHNGSLAGYDTMLDERYHATVKPLDVKPFARPKTANARLVLAEVLTGAACPPCVGADMAFDAVLERYSRQDVALVMYHQHIPGPDPMTNPSTQARGAKDGIYKLQGVPTFAIDGASTVGGGGADQAEGIYKRVSETIEKRLATPPQATLNLKAKMVGSTIQVTADASKIAGKSTKVKLQIALVEEQQRYSGPNGVRFHPMVVRSLAGKDSKGFDVPAGKGLKVEHTFDIAKILAANKKATDEFLDKPFRGGDKPAFTEGRRDDIDPNKLMVVAFVQDEDDSQKAPTGTSSVVRNVLQAAFVKLPATAKKTTN